MRWLKLYREFSVVFYIAVRLVFLIFLAAAAWQDVRKKRIQVSAFLIAGITGTILKTAYIVLETMAETDRAGTLLLKTADTAGGALIGGILLILSAASEESVGKGDGWFFVVSGICLGLKKNLLLLCSSLLLCFPASLFLFFTGTRKGKRAGEIRLPFLPFVALAGMGVMFL